MMNPGYSAYKWLTCAAAPVVLPLVGLHHLFRGDDFSRFYQRLGVYPEALQRSLPPRPRVWMHAVSVGEIGAAAPIVKALVRRLPNCGIVVSTMKEQGLSRALRQFGADIPCFFAPLDILGPTRRALNFVRPDVLVCLETEIWPNMLLGARRMGVRTAIVNGRISVRTVAGYRRFASLMRQTLASVDAFSMISPQDAVRIASIGAPPRRITINGNAKFDGPDPMEGRDIRKGLMALLGIDRNTAVWVAGSTRYAEEPILLNAFDRVRNRFPDALMVIAPRHLERVGQIARWVASHGLTAQLRSEIDGVDRTRTAPVLILDTMGELSDIYSVASCVFCGGSLVPKGGQNILEPAIWGKPTLYGPSMEDFADAVQIVHLAGGGVLVKNAAEVAAAVERWFISPESASREGAAARKAILVHRGAAEQHAAVIADLLR
jgi:3-deoxy-D-manno-octulosonic-acid transferase